VAAAAGGLAVILLDSNVLLIDVKYHNDQNFAKNRQALNALIASGIPIALPTQVILEIVGVLSFGTPAADGRKVWPTSQSRYNLQIVPDPTVVPEHSGCAADEIIAQMVCKRHSGDAVIAAQIAKYAPVATAFLTWNLKHFRGNLIIPVLTPEEWLLQQTPPAAPASPPPPTGPTP
jgi:hypothetical protein